MQLESGTRIGPYEIVSRLGAGGMGEVWRARDTRLDRSVAIKMLPPSLANNAQLKLRFEREAKTISQLQHPHICTLFDVGSDGGQNFLVMELIDGETLAARLARGPLPLEQVLRYGIQIADALAKAHRHGIVHRDLKPGNVMITSGGVKLLDFGLAKQASSAVVGSDATTAVATPSMTPLTAEGTILGTLQYMSPEQLEGIEADARTDIFAFGAVLYEMVTGKLAFQASSKTSLIAAIVDREPAPITSVIAAAPPALDRVISLCLRKKPDDRWQSIQDVRLELEAIAGAAPVTGSAARTGKSAWLGWAAALLIAVIAGAAAWMHLRTDSAINESRRLTFDSPPDHPFRVDQQPPVVSPDGRRFIVGVEGVPHGAQLGIRTIDSFDIQLLPNTGDSYDAFWSPDGKQIAFFQNAKLHRMQANGGAIETLASGGDSRGGSWGADDTIVFAPGTASAIVAISAKGGPSRAVTKLDASRKELGHWRPFFLPDGKHFLYTARSADPDMTAVYCGSVDSFDRKKILDRDTIVVYGDGYLLYVDSDDLYAQRFDAKSIEKIGEPVLVAKDVELTRFLGAPAYSAAAGTLLFFPRAPVANGTLQRITRSDGKRIDLPNAAGENVVISADGAKVATARQDPQTRRSSIWSYDVARQTSNRLSAGAIGNDSSPVWSQDGREIVYAANRDDAIVWIRQPAGGAGAEQTVYELSDAEAVKGGIFQIEPVDWSHDGRYLLADLTTGQSGTDVYYFDLQAPKPRPVPFKITSFSEKSARFSADGRWIAYESDESGKKQIYVQPFPATGAKWQVSVDGGESPRWRPDGREIYFVDPKEAIDVVTVGVRGNELDFGKPAVLVEKASADYDTNDGNAFLVVILPPRRALPMRVITNWTRALDAH
jgi:eukaryotic-like serine/threonine-protein kinase